jgi:folate-dependent phosphoribosylglycinamide formyltransferase PurN
MAEPVRVAVLLSGRGSNMLALSEHKRRDPARGYRIVLGARAGACQKARHPDLVEEP